MTDAELRQELLTRLLAAHRVHPHSAWVSASPRIVPDELWRGIQPLITEGWLEHSGTLLRLTDSGLEAAKQLNPGKESL